MPYSVHIKNFDIATHRVLSALAHETDEINRTHLDTDGIITAMERNGLALPRKQTFDCIQHLRDEEILEFNGVNYCFTVPLYRQWIAWRWKPSIIREEAEKVI